MSLTKDQKSLKGDDSSLKQSISFNPSGMLNMPLGFPSSPESFSNFNMPMVPPHLLLAMQSNLPPEKLKEMLTEHAEMLDQMSSKMKSEKEDDIESVRGNVSKRVNEIERENREYFVEKKLSPERNDYKDDTFAQRDLEMLRQENAAIKIREQTTYLELQKAHHQIHMLESELLELQRKHFSELEHMNFENADLRRRLEAAEYRNVSYI